MTHAPIQCDNGIIEYMYGLSVAFSLIYVIC